LILSHQDNLNQIHQEGDKYRVILHGVGEDSEEERGRFCREISENYGIPASLLKKIVDRCPIVIKKDLTFKKAEVLALTFRSFGASVSVERKRESPPISLEFQGEALSPLALESSCLRRSHSGQWHLVGRVRNISRHDLLDAWVLVQLFDELGELITFEETSLPINPLPSGESTPFRVIFEKNLSLNDLSIVFKNASGHPILAADRREKREWVEVTIPGIEKREQNVSAYQTSKEPAPSYKPEPQILHEQEPPGRIDEDLDKVSVETPFSRLEEEPSEGVKKATEENEDLILDIFERDEQQEEQRFEILSKQDPQQQEVQAILKEEKPELEEHLPSSYSPDIPIERVQEGEPDSFLKEGVTQELKEHSDIFIREEKEKTLLYPWMEEFRRSIEEYYRRHQDPFTVWFKNLLEEGRIESSYHSLLTIFTYARFNQDNHSSKALGNTQKVFKLFLQTDLSLQEIPSLEGTSFIQGEAWRELFFRAIPKLQEVANRMLEKKEWDALDLDRLIRVIPHMSDRNSRWAIQFIGEAISTDFQIDFSQIPVHVGESLYRMASRLGIVNPFFDCYQGRNSMGDMKIQSFARAAFYDNPVKIEDPMTRLGTQEEGGHCYPSQPLCEGCPFNGFCPKLFIEIDPSEKGMINQTTKVSGRN